MHVRFNYIFYSYKPTIRMKSYTSHSTVLLYACRDHNRVTFSIPTYRHVVRRAGDRQTKLTAAGMQYVEGCRKSITETHDDVQQT